MSEDLCSETWTGRDGKDGHVCILPKDHCAKCVCECGERERVANPLTKFTPKTFYKRRKSALTEAMKGVLND